MKIPRLLIIVGIACVIGFSSMFYIEGEMAETAFHTLNSKITFGNPINLSQYIFSRNPQIVSNGNNV